LANVMKNRLNSTVRGACPEPDEGSSLEIIPIPAGKLGRANGFFL
jgi:hypothetical protein